MSGAKLYQMFGEVRRFAEEGRANVLVSLELLRREVEQLRNGRHPDGELTPEEKFMMKQMLAEYRNATDMRQEIARKVKEKGRTAVKQAAPKVKAKVKARVKRRVDARRKK